MYTNRIASVKSSVLKYGLFFLHSLIFGFFLLPCPEVTHLVIMMHAISWQAHFGDRHAVVGRNRAGRRKVPEIRRGTSAPASVLPMDESI